MRKAILFLFILFCSIAQAKDLSKQFEKLYSSPAHKLTRAERESYSHFNFYLVPGILAETFISDDSRSKIDFSFLTGNYFEGELKSLTKKFGFMAKRLSPSSLSIEETRSNIRAVLEESRREKRKAIFICHSLGGIALLEELIENSEEQNQIGGIIFLQSPFSGSPLADLFLKNTDSKSKMLGLLLAWLNVGQETIEILTTAYRKQYMQTHFEDILALTRNVRVITLGGVVNDHATLFQPTMPLIEGESDGMVPFESSKLFDNDFVKLDKADHGELVVRVLFDNFDKEIFTETLLKMLAK